MSNRPGVLSRIKGRVRRKHGGGPTLAWIEIVLKDPCVYCFEYGCDTLEHIIPVSRRDELCTGFGHLHWTNLVPAHKRCNNQRGDGSIFYQKLIPGRAFGEHRGEPDAKGISLDRDHRVPVGSADRVEV